MAADLDIALSFLDFFFLLFKLSPPNSHQILAEFGLTAQHFGFSTFATLSAGATNAPQLSDPKLPQLAELLDPDAAAAILARTLRPGSELGEVRPRNVRYKPGRRVIVAYDAVVDGETREVVVLADVKADLGAVASRKPNVAAARRVNGRSPVDTPLRFDPLAETLVQWLPYDLELPLLTEPPAELLERLARLGLDVDPRAVLRTLGYKPLGRVVLQAGSHVLKGYASESKYGDAARALQIAAATPVPTPHYEARIEELRATVQTALPGTIATDDVALAGVAGSLLRDVHAAHVDGLPDAPSARCLHAAADAGRLVSAVVPALEPRVRALLERLEGGLPENAAHVCSHGDFEVGQLLQHDGDVTLLDFDELCSAPAALDVATYAAHAARSGGAPAALAAADALVETYGARPDGLQPYLAAAILLRAQCPFRKLEEEWPRRVEDLVGAAEEVLA